MTKITLIPVEEFVRIRKAALERFQKLPLLADMCRANTLAAVKRAGSGHLGSSFSAMDIVVWLYYEELNTLRVGFDNLDRDIYFSSKGHDVPGLYSVLFSLGVIPKDKFLKLRRLGGLDGHPDVSVPGIEANSGSLGMGISKAKGMAWAKRLHGNGGRVFVMTGDGELQEGQVYEALQTTLHQEIYNLTVIVDHNKVQSDKQVCEIVDLGDLGAKFRDFGWYVAQCDGHDFTQIQHVLSTFKSIGDKPKILIAHTIKGKGVSFMEHPVALRDNRGLYPWHAGAPDDVSFAKAHDELIGRINAHLEVLGLRGLTLEDVEPEKKVSSGFGLLGEPVSQAADVSRKGAVSDEFVVKAYGQTLVELARVRNDLVVLDADLASDCRIRAFEEAHFERFIENGIAEQDMVSMAGGLARMGLLPVVNTFANFLASRANEQIYNNASENTKIIYVCHYAGLIPSGPGKSHQSIRDISLLGALPNCVILEPCNAAETRMALEYCVNEAKENCVLRLVIGPSPRIIAFPLGYKLSWGRGIGLTEGDDALLFGYGPVLLHEALLASEILRESGFHLRVVNMPWLNRIDTRWLLETVEDYRFIYVLDDHAPVGGLGDTILNALNSSGGLAGKGFKKFGVEGYPACGAPPEVLRYHGLDAKSLAMKILQERDSCQVNYSEKS